MEISDLLAESSSESFLSKDEGLDQWNRRLDYFVLSDNSGPMSHASVARLVPHDPRRGAQQQHRKGGFYDSSRQRDVGAMPSVTTSALRIADLLAKPPDAIRHGVAAVGPGQPTVAALAVRASDGTTRANPARKHGSSIPRDALTGDLFSTLEAELEEIERRYIGKDAEAGADAGPGGPTPCCGNSPLCLVRMSPAASSATSGSGLGAGPIATPRPPVLEALRALATSAAPPSVMAHVHAVAPGAPMTAARAAAAAWEEALDRNVTAPHGESGAMALFRAEPQTLPVDDARCGRLSSGGGASRVARCGNGEILPSAGAGPTGNVPPASGDAQVWRGQSDGARSAATFRGEDCDGLAGGGSLMDVLAGMSQDAAARRQAAATAGGVGMPGAAAPGAAGPGDMAAAGEAAQGAYQVGAARSFTVMFESYARGGAAGASAAGAEVMPASAPPAQQLEPWDHRPSTGTSAEQGHAGFVARVTAAAGASHQQTSTVAIASPEAPWPPPPSSGVSSSGGRASGVDRRARSCGGGSRSGDARGSNGGSGGRPFRAAESASGKAKGGSGAAGTCGGVSLLEMLQAELLGVDRDGGHAAPRSSGHSVVRPIGWCPEAGAVGLLGSDSLERPAEVEAALGLKLTPAQRGGGDARQPPALVQKLLGLGFGLELGLGPEQLHSRPGRHTGATTGPVVDACCELRRDGDGAGLGRTPIQRKQQLAAPAPVMPPPPQQPPSPKLCKEQKGQQGQAPEQQRASPPHQREPSPPLPESRQQDPLVRLSPSPQPLPAPERWPRSGAGAPAPPDLGHQAGALDVGDRVCPPAEPRGTPQGGGGLGVPLESHPPLSISRSPSECRHSLDPGVVHAPGPELSVSQELVGQVESLLGRALQGTSQQPLQQRQGGSPQQQGEGQPSQPSPPSLGPPQGAQAPAQVSVPQLLGDVLSQQQQQQQQQQKLAGARGGQAAGPMVVASGEGTQPQSGGGLGFAAGSARTPPTAYGPAGHPPADGPPLPQQQPVRAGHHHPQPDQGDLKLGQVRAAEPEDVAAVADPPAAVAAGPRLGQEPVPTTEQLEAAAGRAEAAALAMLAEMEQRLHEAEEETEAEEAGAAAKQGAAVGGDGAPSGNGSGLCPDVDVTDWELQLGSRLGDLDLDLGEAALEAEARGSSAGESRDAWGWAEQRGLASDELLRSARQAALQALDARLAEAQARYNARRQRRHAPRPAEAAPCSGLSSARADGHSLSDWRAQPLHSPHTQLQQQRAHPQQAQRTQLRSNVRPVDGQPPSTSLRYILSQMATPLPCNATRSSLGSLASPTSSRCWANEIGDGFSGGDGRQLGRGGGGNWLSDTSSRYGAAAPSWPAAPAPNCTPPPPPQPASARCRRYGPGPSSGATLLSPGGRPAWDEPHRDGAGGSISSRGAAATQPWAQTPAAAASASVPATPLWATTGAAWGPSTSGWPMSPGTARGALFAHQPHLNSPGGLPGHSVESAFWHPRNNGDNIRPPWGQTLATDRLVPNSPRLAAAVAAAAAGSVSARAGFGADGLQLGAPSPPHESIFLCATPRGRTVSSSGAWPQTADPSHASLLFARWRQRHPPSPLPRHTYSVGARFADATPAAPTSPPPLAHRRSPSAPAIPASINAAAYGIAAPAPTAAPGAGGTWLRPSAFAPLELTPDDWVPLPGSREEVAELRTLCSLACSLPQLDALERVQLWERLEQLLAQKLAASPHARSRGGGEGRSVRGRGRFGSSGGGSGGGVQGRSDSPLRGYAALFGRRQRSGGSGGGSGRNGGSAGRGPRDHRWEDAHVGRPGGGGGGGSGGGSLLDSTLEVVHSVIAPNGTLAHALSLNWQAARSQAAAARGEPGRVGLGAR